MAIEIRNRMVIFLNLNFVEIFNETVKQNE